jgi:tetratricopeptide (TPR) repeat protein
MPRYASADIAHTASTDHRILRRPGASAPETSGRSQREPTFVSFYQSNGGSGGSRNDERDLGVALAQILVPLSTAQQGHPDRLGRRAIRMLDRAIEGDPADTRALEARAELQAMLGQYDDALEEFDAILSSKPSREKPLRGAAVIAEGKKEFGRALTYWRRLVEVNPWQADHRASLAQLLARMGYWDEALVQARSWLRLDPASVEARVFLVRCLLGKDDKAAAREEFATLERLRPGGLDDLRRDLR